MIIANTRKNRGEKGVTLIEVVISILILGIVMTGILGYFQWSFGLFNRVDTISTSESLARTQMEKIKSDNFSTTGEYSLVPDIPYGYIVAGIDENKVADPPTSNKSKFGYSTNVTGLQKIRIMVERTYFTKPGSTDTDQVILEGYKSDR